MSQPAHSGESLDTLMLPILTILEGMKLNPRLTLEMPAVLRDQSNAAAPCRFDACIKLDGIKGFTSLWMLFEFISSAPITEKAMIIKKQFATETAEGNPNHKLVMFVVDCGSNGMGAYTREIMLVLRMWMLVPPHVALELPHGHVHMVGINLSSRAKMDPQYQGLHLDVGDVPVDILREGRFNIMPRDVRRLREKGTFFTTDVNHRFIIPGQQLAVGGGGGPRCRPEPPTAAGNQTPRTPAREGAGGRRRRIKVKKTAKTLAFTSDEDEDEGGEEEEDDDDEEDEDEGKKKKKKKSGGP